MLKEKPVCPYCGSERITMDGPLRWDPHTDAWVPVDVWDTTGTCADCGQCEFDPAWVEVKPALGTNV